MSEEADLNYLNIPEVVVATWQCLLQSLLHHAIVRGIVDHRGKKFVC
jgi:hypothetical protein